MVQKMAVTSLIPVFQELKSNLQVSRIIGFAKMFFHKSYIFLFGKIPCTISDEINDLVVKPETPFKNTNLPSTPRPTSQRERKPVHDTPSIYYDKQVVYLPLKFPISVLTHTHTHTCF